MIISVRPFFTRLIARAMIAEEGHCDPSKHAFRVYYDYEMHI
jgi:hypothetical protein